MNLLLYWAALCEGSQGVPAGVVSWYKSVSARKNVRMGESVEYSAERNRLLVWENTALCLLQSWDEPLGLDLGETEEEVFLLLCPKCPQVSQGRTRFIKIRERTGAS